MGKPTGRMSGRERVKAFGVGFIDSLDLLHSRSQMRERVMASAGIEYHRQNYTRDKNASAKL
jgi:hypothetical protein